MLAAHGREVLRIRTRTEREIERAVLQLLDQLRRAALDEFELDVGHRAAKAVRSRQHRDARQRCHPDGEPALPVLAQLRHFLLGARNLIDDQFGPLQHRAPRIGQRHARRTAGDQHQPELVLEIAQRARDGRLREVQGTRGFMDAARAGNGHERAELVKFHATNGTRQTKGIRDKQMLSG